LIAQPVTINMRQLMLTFVFMLPAIAQAGPWCLMLDENMGCSFESSEACYLVAGRQGGNCMPNPLEAGVTGDKAWCVITSNMRRCTYPFQSRCTRAAEQLNGGCVQNTEKLLEAGQFNDLIGVSKYTDVSAANGCKGDLACEAALSAVQ